MLLRPRDEHQSVQLNLKTKATDGEIMSLSTLEQVLY